MAHHQTKRSRDLLRKEFDALTREELDSFKREYEANPRKATLDLINNIRVDAMSIIQSQLQVGRGLLALRTACNGQAGEFLTRLKTLHLKPSAVARLMLFAAKFATQPSKENLLFAIGNIHKAHAMLFLSDPQINELAVSGETAGGDLRVAAIAHMNERELRKAVRKLCGKCVMPIRYYPDLQGSVTPPSKILQ